MKTSISLRLDKRHKKNGGVYPIILRIGHKRRTNGIKIGYEVSEKDWDSKNYEIKSSYKGTESVVRLNKLLHSKRAIGLGVIAKLDDEERLNNLSVTNIKKEIMKALNMLVEDASKTSSETDSSDFFSFTTQLINYMIEAKQVGNARVYKDVRNMLRTYMNGKPLSFSQLDYNFLERFEIKHYAKGNSTNSLSVYMRTIRAIYNKAIKKGVVDKELYPFKDYKIKEEPTRKRAIDKEAIMRIINLPLEPVSKLHLNQDMFTASYCLMGMNYADLCLLKVKDIISGRIKYQREKTHQEFNVKINSKLQSILNRYIKSKKPNDYIFPIVKRNTAEDIYKDIEWARARQNKRLKELAKLAGVDENLTTYVARHSFATIAKNQGVPVSALQEMFKHKNLKTTQVYLDSLPSNVIDDYQDKILGFD